MNILIWIRALCCPENNVFCQNLQSVHIPSSRRKHRTSEETQEQTKKGTASAALRSHSKHYQFGHCPGSEIRLFLCFPVCFAQFSQSLHVRRETLLSAMVWALSLSALLCSPFRHSYTVYSTAFFVVSESSLWTEQQLIPGICLLDRFIFLVFFVTRLWSHKLDWKLLCVPLSPRPWLNQLIISDTILSPSLNDIPCGCEHVSVPSSAAQRPSISLPPGPPSWWMKWMAVMLLSAAPEWERRSPPAEILLETRKLWRALKAILFSV